MTWFEIKKCYLFKCKLWSISSPFIQGVTWLIRCGAFMTIDVKTLFYFVIMKNKTFTSNFKNKLFWIIPNPLVWTFIIKINDCHLTNNQNSYIPIDEMIFWYNKLLTLHDYFPKRLQKYKSISKNLKTNNIFSWL